MHALCCTETLIFLLQPQQSMRTDASYVDAVFGLAIACSVYLHDTPDTTAMKAISVVGSAHMTTGAISILCSVVASVPDFETKFPCLCRCMSMCDILAQCLLVVVLALLILLTCVDSAPVTPWQAWMAIVSALELYATATPILNMLVEPSTDLILGVTMLGAAYLLGANDNVVDRAIFIAGIAKIASNVLAIDHEPTVIQCCARCVSTATSALLVLVVGVHLAPVVLWQLLISALIVCQCIHLTVQSF